MPALRILVTNDDGWDAAGLAALKSVAAEIGQVFVLAPRDPHSYAGHRVTTDRPLRLMETAEREFSLTGTPADCVRVALTSLFPDVDLVLSGINHGGNLGADLYTSATAAAAREAALLGKPGIAVSQYLKSRTGNDWNRSRNTALPVVRQLIEEPWDPGVYWNVNLPYVESDGLRDVVRCDPDRNPLDVRYERVGDEFRYAGSYHGRTKAHGTDIHHCFEGSITVSRLTI